ncbi:uncharacterized protein LOC124315998 [Daphnia pulicaria]|uniref:uncharacterized protein LOC124315998 n=1 Tax=Daphnia pulicaria TaxID=35523 RepID=UPI001EEA637F|nr:uncharacterized protein LOC124315998 [Daphnia pulicaria]
MRFTVVCARVCLWIHCWCSWKRWLYLTTFLLTSSHFFLSEKFLPNLKNQMDITDVSQPGTTQENVISSSINQLNNNLNKSTIFTGAKSDSVQSTTKKSNDGNEETNQRKIEQVNNSLLEEKERRYRLRSERVKRVCLSRGVVSNPPIFTMSKKELPINSPDLTNLSVSVMSVENPVTSHFSMAPTFQTMGCFLNKVASSSLVSAFLLLHGLGPTFSSPHSLTSYLFPTSLENFQFANQTFFKFMFVRHPMDRMLSCYLDKMVDSPHRSLPDFRNYVRNEGRRIVMKRRRRRRRRNNNKAPHHHHLRSLLLVHEISASSIWNRLKSQISEITHHDRRLGKGYDGPVNNVAERKRKSKGSSHRHAGPHHFIASQPAVNASSNKINATTEAKPTFEEFLEFVLDTDLLGMGFDSHWVPFHRYCSPCSVPYHVIGKLETATDDFQYIWEKTGLGKQVPVPWMNRKTVPSKSKIALEKKYYSSLPRDLILRFYDAFRMDFELFDYSINDILLKAGFEAIT